MNLGGCSALTQTPETHTWYRAIQPQFWNTALATAHTRTIPSRFSASSRARPGFEILYLAENHQVALFEVQALIGSPTLFLPNPAGAWVIINVTVSLSNVADLCDQAEYAKVDSSIQELTGDWRGFRMRNPPAPTGAVHGTDVPTQQLGYQLFATKDVEAFRFYSAKVSTHRNVAIFPTKLLASSRVEFTHTDTVTGKTTRYLLPKAGSARRRHP